MNRITMRNVVEPSVVCPKPSPGPRLSVVIPTMNRDKELQDCVRTLLRQTWVPDELVIVDNAELDDTAVREMAAQAGVRYVFLRIARPGITSSRNIGVDHTTGRIIMFLDDDCLLHSHYVEEVMRVFVEDTRGEVGGTCGMGAVERCRNAKGRLWKALATCFCLQGRRRHEGRLLPNGFSTDMHHLDGPTDVDYLPGCFMTYRREVLDEERFDEFFDGYGTGEDKEFSHRVSKKYRLVILPDAIIYHLAVPSGRTDFMTRGFQAPYNNAYIFKKLLPQTLGARLMFAWSMVGSALLSGVALAGRATRARLDELLGTIKGIMHLVLHRPFRQIHDHSPLRVMFVTTEMSSGGYEQQLINLIGGMDRARFAPMVCCLKRPGPLGAQLRSDGVPVFAGLTHNRYDARVLYRLVRLMRRERVDVAFTVGTGGDRMFWGRLAARLAGVRTIISALHSMGVPDHVEWVNKLLHGLNHAFVAVAGVQKQYLIEREGTPRQRTHVIYNGVDPERWAHAEPNLDAAQTWGIPEQAPVAGIVACLRPEKNHELFLRAGARVLEQLKQARLLVVGDGPRREDLVHLADQLGITGRVHFVGNRTDVPHMVALMDVVVLSSICEAFPMAILEAMAAGKPVVATDVGAVSEAVRDGQTGFLVSSGDVDAMAARITALLDDPALARRLGQQGRRLVAEQFSLRRMVERHQRLFLALSARHFRTPRVVSPRPTHPQERDIFSSVTSCQKVAYP